MLLIKHELQYSYIFCNHFVCKYEKTWVETNPKDSHRLALEPYKEKSEEIDTKQPSCENRVHPKRKGCEIKGDDVNDNSVNNDCAYLALISLQPFLATTFDFTIAWLFCVDKYFL